MTQMSETAFVFDEVHKAMQKQTKRTAAALALARIARQLVALTGTPIVDKSGYGLMKWLELCVPFPVSASNFWVAANSMISPLNTGDVVTEDVIVQARESEEDKAFFNMNFPFRAPWHGQTHTPTAKECCTHWMGFAKPMKKWLRWTPEASPAFPQSSAG